MKTPVKLARVLLVDDDPASRLTLQTLLRAGGYQVETAASAAEAMGKMDEREYELVLSDIGMESPEAGYRVLAHARVVNYQPATALVTTYRTQSTEGQDDPDRTLIEPEDVEGLLTHVAEMISQRASRRLKRDLRLSARAATSLA